MSSSQKLLHLEGMRGLMALNVILCHFVCVYYPEMYFYGEEFSGALSFFSTTPFSVLVNGNIAVVFFFALTGFLVGRSAFIKDYSLKTIPSKAANRYIRLLPTIAIATLFVFFTMKLGLQGHLKITNENVHLAFLHDYCDFKATIENLLSNIFFDSFVTSNEYVGPFWTIKYEFWGYIIVLAVASLLKKFKWRRLAYLIFAILLGAFFDSYYIIFLLGLLVADLEFNPNPTFLDHLYKNLLKNKIFIAVCFLFSVYFSCCPMFGDFPIYSFWFNIPVVHPTLLRGIGMALFIYVSINSRIIQKLLSFKPLVFVGEMSFETYAIHWPLMLTCEAWLFIVFEKYMSYDAAALLAFAITLIVIYIASFLFNLLTKQINKGIFVLQNKRSKKP